MRRIAILMGMIMILVGNFFIVNFLDTYAAEEKKILTGKVYDLGEKINMRLTKQNRFLTKQVDFI